MTKHTAAGARSLQLSQSAARGLLLTAQGLLHPPQQTAVKPDLLRAIRRMGALQIDTIHVVARSPYFGLWSRLGAYEPSWLDDLLAEGALFEYWAHAACFLPIEDYPHYRKLMLEGLVGWRSGRDWLAEHEEEVAQLLERIRSGGPVRSADFTRADGRGGTWWDWKPEKLALEHLHNAGALMTARRHNFQRIYDVRERVLPDWNDSAAPSLDQAQRYFALIAVRALGVAPATWVPDYFRTSKKGILDLLEALVHEGGLLRVHVDGWDSPAYVHPDNQTIAELAAASALHSEVTTLLSPFDPIVWDRARARSLFNFDYTIECYTPAAKHRYGYFTLPLVHHGTLVGRVDAKAH
ncbi:MAG: winged helix-turn-helix domain-containing protein, partial [Dehalococcoidia bacterium]